MNPKTSNALTRRASLATALLATLTYVAPLQAQMGSKVRRQQPFENVKATEEGELLASLPGVNDSFGSSVAISGNTAVIGAEYGLSLAGESGSADVFVRSAGGWVWQAQLTASDALRYDKFGWSVSISGDTIVIGTPFGDSPLKMNSGSAYVFTRQGGIWTEQAKLTVDTDDYIGFGSAVSICGETLVVGAHHDNTTHTWAGAAYVFERNGTNWNQVARLRSSEDPLDARYDLLGSSISIDGDTILVGASAANNIASFGAGCAYVYDKPVAGWQDMSESARLETPNLSLYAEFGCSVSLSGDTALVGAFADEVALGFSPGSAFIFKRTDVGWIPQAKLNANDAMHRDHFGRSVSLSGGTALVGAPDESFPGSGLGSAYVYAQSSSGWCEVLKLTASDGLDLDHYGHSVAVYDNHVLASAIDHTGGNVFRSGAVYALQLSAAWPKLGSGTAGTYGIPILSSSSTLIAGGPLRLQLSGALENTPVTLIIGNALARTPLLGGLLIPTQDIIYSLMSNAAGELTFELELPINGASGLYYFQCWIRDPSATFGYAATQGIGAATP